MITFVLGVAFQFTHVKLQHKFYDGIFFSSNCSSYLRDGWSYIVRHHIDLPRGRRKNNKKKKLDLIFCSNFSFHKLFILIYAFSDSLYLSSFPCVFFTEQLEYLDHTGKIGFWANFFFYEIRLQKTEK